MTTNNIFGNDILNGDLTTSLVPELGQENILIDVTPPEISLIDPLNQELPLIEQEVAITEIDIDNNSLPNNASSFSNIIVANIDSLTAANPEELQVNNVSTSNALFTPPIDELQFQGGFGDYDGGNDVTFEVKNDDEVVVETYSLTGKGQASLYRDDEDGKAYVFFSGTDETTSVEISAKSNIQFDSYIGDSLKIETTGSIDAGSVALSNPDETGLVLKSGIQAGEETLEVLGYDAIHLGEGTAKGINNEGEVVVDGYGASLSYIYSDGEINYIGSDNSITSNGINDSGQVVGSFTSSDNNTHAFISSGGAISDLGVLPEAETYEIYNGSDFEEVPYNFARSYGKAINNNGQVVGTASSKYSVGYDESRSRAFISGGGPMTDLQNDLNDLFGYEVDLDENPDAYWFFASEAYGINDSGQIVGSHFNYDGQQKAFVYGGGQNINLHSLLGDDVRSSNAHGINNNGQVIGSFTTKRYSTGFVYSNGEIKNIGGTLFDINNNGIVAKNASLYDINKDTTIDLNIDSTIDSEEAIWLSSAQGINDEGQIAATGYFTGDTGRTNNAFLLNPQFTEPELDDYINIGNISTFGDTVLLRGNEITLAGSAVTTQGGEITFDGATTANSNLIINTSVTENEVITDGGDITFTGTLDSSSAGSNNLRLQSGTGNILFSETVGGEAAFFDLAVEGADTVTINNDLAVDGNFSLEVINDITTANLSAAGLVNISLGKVGDEIYPSAGNVTTGNIDALGLEVLNNGNFTAGNLTTTDGDINVISLNQLDVGQLMANNGAVDLISGTAGINVNGTVQGDNGFIALAQQDIVTNEITSRQDAVILKSSQGAVTVNGLVTAFGDASLTAAGDVTVGTVTSSNESVALISASGIINFAGAISSKEDVTVASAQSLTIDQEIKAELGTTALVSSEGSVTTTAKIDSGMNINIAAKQNVDTKTIRTYGGNIIVNAEQGTAIIRRTIRSGGGDISISASGRVRTKNLISRSGDVSVISDSGVVRTGYIRTDRGNRSGDVYLEAARNIKVAASFEMNGEQYSIYAGEDGVISVAHQQNKKENKRGQFVIGNTTGSGTLALVTSPVTNPTPTTPGGGGSGLDPRIIIIIETFRRILDAGDANAPTIADAINPLTGNPYADEAERELVKQLTPDQRKEISEWVNSKTGRKVQLDPTEVFEKGKIDDEGCFTAELGIHFGDWIDDSAGGLLNITHSRYATQITGADGDYFVVTPVGLAALFDGLVKSDGQIVQLGLEGVGSVTEVKTGQQLFLRKALLPGDPAYLNWNVTQQDRNNLERFERQLFRELGVATACGMRYFMSFSNSLAAQAADSLYGDVVAVYDIPVRVNL